MFEFPSNILNLLPPVATSFGVIPFLIKSSPIAQKESIKYFVIAIYLIIIWLGYICALMIAKYLFFPLNLTIAALCIGIILFFLLFLFIIGEEESKDKPQKAKQGKLTVLYALGIFFITVGFTSYSANQGKITFCLLTSKKVYDFEVMFLDADANKDMTAKLHLRKVPLKKYLGCIIDKKQFNQIKKVTVYYFENESEKDHKDIEVSNYNLQQVGLGGDYVIRF